MSTNAPIAHVFRLAKTHLSVDGSDDKVTCICFAIDAAYRNRQCAARDAEEAKRIIDILLGEEIAVYWWLRNVAKIPPNLLTKEALQTYRHTWLDHLIAEYSN